MTPAKCKYCGKRIEADKVANARKRGVEPKFCKAKNHKALYRRRAKREAAKTQPVVIPPGTYAVAAPIDVTQGRPALQRLLDSLKV